MNVPIIVIVGFLIIVSALVVWFLFVLYQRDQEIIRRLTGQRDAIYALRKCEVRAEEYAHKSNIVSDFAKNFSEALSEGLLLMRRAATPEDEEEDLEDDLRPNLIRVLSLVVDTWDSIPSNLKGQLPFSEKLVEKIGK